MIKINLVRIGKGGSLQSPVTLTSDSGSGAGFGSDQVQKQGVLKIFLILFGPTLMWVYFERMQNPDLKQQMVTLNGDLAQLQTQNKKAIEAVAATKNFQEQQKSLREKIEVIERLRRGRLLEVRILDTIQKGIPPKVWLSRLDFKDVKLQINGSAIDSNDVTSFEEQLRGSVFMKETKTIRISEANLGSVVGKNFQIEATLETEIKSSGGNSGTK